MSQDTIYTGPQKKLYFFVMRIEANLVNIPLEWDKFLIGKTSGCQIPKILLIQIFDKKS